MVASDLSLGKHNHCSLYGITVGNQLLSAKNFFLGGFQGSKDPMGDCLSKKRTMLAAEGVHFATEKPKARTIVPATIGKKRKLSADKSEGTASVRIAENSVYRF